MTSIAVTHDLICAQIIADRVIVLNDGIILFEGDLATLTSLDDPFLKNFFSPEYLEDNYG